MDDRDLSVAPGGISPRRRFLPALLKAVLPLLLIGGTAAVLVMLHRDGTLRTFLDRQSMLGMIAVVLVVNAVGFSFVYMASSAWKSIKRDLGRDDDW
ncbi:hypothetical protein [Arenibaculum sp.]|jgi:predicted tellurium resistance membrane protein TerC|uniref:hypothetical protein n=1 Tax=Arenibaculum sp. TaxID=2865862 RepID=UPI002E1237BA|nr:hypothetical protein [Arenibaculum sp.]